MTWAQYRERMANTSYSSDLEYKTHYAWIHGEKTLRASTLLDQEAAAVRIPESITGDNGRRYPVHAISGGLFSGNAKVIDIVLPSGISEIPSRAFSGCVSLKSICLPAGIRRIGEAAFDGCASLSDIYYAGSQSEWSRINIVRDKHEIEFGPLVSGSPVHEILDDRIVRIPGNEAVYSAAVHINCNTGG